MRAVLTRDAERSREYVAALAQHGIIATCLPVTTTAPALDQAALLGAARVAATYDAIGFASHASVRPFVTALTASGAAIGPNTLVVAVGAATQRALAEHGIAATVAELANAAGLAATIVAQLTAHRRIGRGAPARVLLPRAEDGRVEAGITLRSVGLIVDEVIAYRTLPRAAASLSQLETQLLTELRTGAIAALCIFAPSQVAALATLLGTAPNLPPNIAQRFIAIGETTAQALRHAGITHVTVAQAPTPQALAAATVLA
ncbi:MAG: uroporphyrinogen-III synthase [Kofleriaceae bacterium]|nr:uroporphyrinogen-III synthase [Kofleriaceae bacterium]